MGKNAWKGFDLSKNGAELCQKQDYDEIYNYYQNSLNDFIQKLINGDEELSEEEKKWLINEIRFPERQLLENFLPPDNPTLVAINEKFMIKTKKSGFKMIL